MLRMMKGKLRSLCILCIFCIICTLLRFIVHKFILDERFVNARSDYTGDDVSIVIAVHPPHFKYLQPLLDSFERQTVRPGEIIIAASEYSAIAFPKLHTSFNIKYVFSNEKQNAAQNRNKGTAIATKDLIMIHDADDFMNDKKIEQCVKSFNKKSDMMMLLHDYEIFKTENYQRNGWSKDVGKLKYERIYNHPNGKNISRRNNITGNNIPNDGSITHGHPVFKRYVLKRVKYTPSLNIAEDIRFIRDCISQIPERNVYVINRIMTGYRFSERIEEYERQALYDNN